MTQKSVKIWIFSDYKIDDVIIWGQRVTLEFTPMIFEFKNIWAIHSN